MIADMRLPSALVCPPAKPLKSNRMTRNSVRFAESPFVRRAGPASMGEQHNPGPVAFTQFLIGGAARGEKLIAAIGPNSLAGNQLSKRTHHLGIEQMRNHARLVAPGQIASDGIGQRAVREGSCDNGGIEIRLPDISAVYVKTEGFPVTTIRLQIVDRALGWNIGCSL